MIVQNSRPAATIGAAINGQSMVNGLGIKNGAAVGSAVISRPTSTTWFGHGLLDDQTLCFASRWRPTAACGLQSKK
jgi:hypothetical protein